MDLTELVRQVGVLTEQNDRLGRKVSALTGRVTVAGKHTDRVLTTLLDLLTMTVAARDDVPAAPPVGKHAAAKRRRHLRVVR
jgi:hypothetical protein